MEILIHTTTLLLYAIVFYYCKCLIDLRFKDKCTKTKAPIVREKTSPQPVVQKSKRQRYL